jgi:hypothetical protein
MSGRMDYFHGGSSPEFTRKLNQLVDGYNALINIRGDKNIRARYQPGDAVTLSFLFSQIIPYTPRVVQAVGSSAAGFFPVTVSVSTTLDTGGPTSTADFLYKVTHKITHAVLADNQTSLLVRPPNVVITAGHNGIAIYDGSPSPGSSFADPNLLLYVLDEQRATRTCGT